jgi:hypothetical protein
MVEGLNPEESEETNTELERAMADLAQNEDERRKALGLLDTTSGSKLLSNMRFDHEADKIGERLWGAIEGGEPAERATAEEEGQDGTSGSNPGPDEVPK